ncbi:hypothetical protein Q5752_006286 [Cryptotrichosporon argae]
MLTTGLFATPSLRTQPSYSSAHAHAHSHHADGARKRNLSVLDEGAATSTESEDDAGHVERRTKRKTGKACVYCRRSHMVCEGGRPCERCIKRDIAHLCRDVTPPAHSHPKKETEKDSSSKRAAAIAVSDVPAPAAAQPAYTNGSGLTSSWPLLPDSSTQGLLDGLDGVNGLNSIAGQSRDTANTDFGTLGVSVNGEFGALSDFLKSLQPLTLPADLVQGLTQIMTAPTPPVQPDQRPPFEQATLPPDAGPVVDKGKARANLPQLTNMSPIDQYLLAAADQPDGSRASRLSQVIRAKYEAGLLKPYDYIRGYERMNRWMDSGRASPKTDTDPDLDPATSVGSGTVGDRRRLPPSGSSISPDSRRRILAALAGFRLKFRQIARTLTDVDLMFVEEAIERLMLQYDRALASIHTPSCVWRRTGEIQKGNQEFAKLTGIPAPMFRNGQLCVYELMDEASAVRYWEGYGKVAFDKGQSHVWTHCTLKIPLSLTRHHSGHPGLTPAVEPTNPQGTVPELSLGLAAVGMATEPQQEQGYRTIRTCFSVTIRRDKYHVPVAILGQWIPY